MRSSRSATTALVLFVALAFAWIVVRKHIPVPTGNARRGATADRAASLSASIDTPAVNVAAAGATPQPPPSEHSASVDGGRSSTYAATSAAPRILPPPPADPETAQADAASTNAIKVRHMITDYHTLNGENPVGTNAEIMAAIMGRNSRHATLGPPGGMGLNSQGELVDDWGTPYFFHQLSKDLMEIHSAGPDKILGTADDIVVR